MLGRVLEVHIPRGSIEPRHRHPHGLSVYFTDWAAKVTVDGKEPQVNLRKAGKSPGREARIPTSPRTSVRRKAMC